MPAWQTRSGRSKTSPYFAAFYPVKALVRQDDLPLQCSSMFIELVDHLKEQVHASAIGGMPPIMWFADNVLDFVTSPFTGLRTRSYWPELVASLLIALALFLHREPRASRTLGGFLRFCFPGAMWRHRSTWVDWQIIVMNQFFARSFNVTWRVSGALLAGMMLQGLIRAFGPSPQLLTWTPLTLVLYTILFGVADDLGYFIFHLASHRNRWLWAFHKVHHSAETLTVLANVRTHPVEYAVLGPVKAVTTAMVLAPALYLGTGQATMIDILGMNLMVVIWCVLGTQLHHSHIWLSWGPALEHVLISPALHQIHHSSAPRHWNRNMGANLAVWDWMCGTLYVPREREELTFGLGEGVAQPYPNGLVAYVRPFWEILPQRAQTAIRHSARRPLPSLQRLFADTEPAHPAANQPQR
jgi:sterol desaturase/sphingolipid hydroxylase (fatty acid hydroxylase superfamily)